MAGELAYQWQTTGDTLHARIADGATIWNDVAGAFETWDDAKVAEYAIALVEQGTGAWFLGDFPAAISAGQYSIGYFRQLPGGASLTDVPLSGRELVWDGTAEADLWTIYQAILAVGSAGPWTTSDGTEVLAEGGPGPWATGAGGGSGGDLEFHVSETTGSLG